MIVDDIDVCRVTTGTLFYVFVALRLYFSLFLFWNDTATIEIDTLSRQGVLPIGRWEGKGVEVVV